MTPYATFFLYLLASVGLVALILGMNALFGPRPAASAAKLEPFECGAEPIQHRNVRPLSIKYYPIAIFFLLFDLETVLLFIWAAAAGQAAGRDAVAAVVPVLHGAADGRVRLPLARRSARMAMMDYLTTRKDDLVGWVRKFSLFPYPFVTACCGMEFMSVSSTLYDTDRFGAALPRFTPRQSDLLMVVGTVSHKQAPILSRIYDQMCEPKWVMAFGACATSGGFYRNYAVVQGVDKIIPVDIYVPGCPPRPEMVIDAIMMLQDRIASDRHPILPSEQPPPTRT